MNRLPVVATALVVFALAGCQSKKADPVTRMEEPYIPLDRYDSTAPAYAEQPTDSTTYTAPEPVVANDELLAPADTAGEIVGGQTITVRRGDTLYALARRHYNDQAKWREIWDANRTQVPDPHKISVGMQLVIP